MDNEWFAQPAAQPTRQQGAHDSEESLTGGETVARTSGVFTRLNVVSDGHFGDQQSRSLQTSNNDFARLRFAVNSWRLTQAAEQLWQDLRAASLRAVRESAGWVVRTQTRVRSNLANRTFRHRFGAVSMALSFVVTHVVPPLPQLIIPAGTASFSPAAAAAVDAIPSLPLPEPNAAIVSDGLPTGAAASAGGVTSGGFSVTAGGAATYAIPLRVPAGRAGYAPSVAINFSSAAGNGPLGVGFSVSAAGAISRCEKTLALDGVARGVQVDDQDNLCLNGNKLVTISGNYWADGAVYRTQPDTGVRVLGHRLSGSSAGPTHFEVSLPDGQTHFYGRDTFGSFDVAPVVKNGVKWNVSWPLLATRDGAGNRIDYHYTKHYENGIELERYLSQISYGNNPIFNDRQIILEYEDRPDRSFAFQYGRRVQSTKRLSRVAMQVNAGGWKQVREYRLAYESIFKSVTRRSRLSSITECGAAIEGLPVACLNPTTFEWSPSAGDDDYFGVGAVQGFTNPIGASTTLITTDLDGDGRTDLAFPSSTAWHYVFARPTPVNGNRYYEHFVTAKAPGVALPGPLKGVASTAYVFDADFDDQPDLLFRDSHGGESWRGYLTRGSGGTVAPLITSFYGSLNESTNVNATVVFADFDGDGLQDMLERFGGPPGTSLHNWAWRRRADSVALVPQNGMLLESKGWGPFTMVPALGSLGVNQVVALDAFGEGRSRVIHKAPSGFLTARSLVDGNERTLILPAELLTLDIRTADLNGDGLTDLITNGSGLTPTPDGQLRYILNTGNGYSAPIMMQQAVAGWKAARVIDVNSDGLADLIVPRLDLNNPTLARGIDLIQTHFDAQGWLTFHRKPLFDIPQTSIVELARNGLRIVDVEGDGDPDLLHVRSDGVKSLYKHGSPGKPDELQVIRDGRHMPGGPAGIQPIGTVSITYAPATDATVYERGDCLFIAFMSCLRPGPKRLVKKVVYDAGIHADGSPAADVRNVSDYVYRTGRFDRKTGAFAGFAETLVTSYVQGKSGSVGHRLTRSFYSNTVAGRAPQLQERWDYTYPGTGPHDALVRTTYEWKQHPLAAGATYLEYVKVTRSRTYQDAFSSDACQSQPSACPHTMSIATFDAKGYTPYLFRSSERFDLDGYGNVRRTRSWNGPFETTSETEFNYDLAESQWLTGRVKKSRVRDVGKDDKFQIRTVETTYHETAGKQHLVKQRKSYRDGPFFARLSVDYDYDGQGLLIRETGTDLTAIGSVGADKIRETTFAYDNFGYPHAVRTRLGTSYTGYAPLLGVLQVAVDINGLKTKHAYDTLGRRIATRAPDGVETKVAYALESVAQETLPRVESLGADGSSSQTVFDRAGRTLLTRFKGFDGVMRQKETKIDLLAQTRTTGTYRRQGSTEAVDQVVSAYDSQGRRVKITQPGGYARHWEYDKLAVVEIDTRSNKRSVLFDERGRRTQVTDGSGAEAVTRIYLYGPFDTLLRTELLGVPNSASEYTYLDTGELVSSSDPERGYKRYLFNGFGQLLERSDHESPGPAYRRKTSILYDVLGRQLKVTVSEDGSIRSVTEHSYDSVPAPEGRIRLGALLRSAFTDSVAGGAKHTTDYFFDGLGRPIRTDYTLPSDLEPSASQTFRIVTGYDSLGRVASVTYPKLPGHADATVAFFEHAPAETSNGRLAKVSSAERLQVGAPTKLTTLWKAEATDQQDRLRRFMAGSVHTEHQFDWRGLTTSTVIRNDDLDVDSSNVALAMLQFAYDGEGNLSSRSDDLQPATRHYRYDSMNRLQWELTDAACTLSVFSKCVVDALAYDKLGNLAHSKLRGVYTFNPLKPTQLMSATGGSVANGTRTYAYDYLGNQVERPDGSVTFNDFNLPARIVGKTNAGEVTATFLYAANGSRARRETRDETVTYAGPYERHRKAGTNRVEHRLHVPGIGATLRYEGDAFVSKLPTAFSHGDHLGSTSLVTQNELEASGGMFTKVLEKRHYEAFGLPMNPNWSAPNPFSDLQTPVLDQGFTGHTEDRAIGVVSMRGRMYDAELGRFITTDPLVDGANPSQAWNRYAYVSNNPLRYTDPSGFFMDHDNGGRGGDCQHPDGTPCVAAGPGPEQFQSSGGMFGFIVPLGAALFAGSVALYNWAKDNIHIGGGSKSPSPPSYIPPAPGRDGGGGASGGPPGDGGHGGSGNAPKQPAPSTDGSPGGPQGGGGGEGGNSGVPNYGPGNGQECTSGDDPYIGEDRRFSHTEALGTLGTGLGLMSGVGALGQLGWTGGKYYAGQAAIAGMEASIGVRIASGGAAAAVTKSGVSLLEEESGVGQTPLVFAEGIERLAVDGRNFTLPFEVQNGPYETMAIGENIAASAFANEKVVLKLPPLSMAVSAHGSPLGTLVDETPTVGTFLSAASELASDSGIPFVRGFCMVCYAGRGPLPALQAAVTGLPTYSGITRVGSFGSGFHRLHLPVLNNLNRANSLMCGR